MGRHNQKSDAAAGIDACVAKIAMGSHFWDTRCTVGPWWLPPLPGWTRNTCGSPTMTWRTRPGRKTSSVTPPRSHRCCPVNSTVRRRHWTPRRRNSCWRRWRGRSDGRSAPGPWWWASPITGRWLWPVPPRRPSRPPICSPACAPAWARAPAAGGAREIAVTFSGPVSELPDSPCHAIELRIHRSHDRVHLDWWYDPARFYPYTVVELAEQFPLALIEVCSEATVPSVPRPARSLICTAP